jgi:hypothetical protein
MLKKALQNLIIFFIQNNCDGANFQKKRGNLRELDNL